MVIIFITIKNVPYMFRNGAIFYDCTVNHKNIELPFNKEILEYMRITYEFIAVAFNFSRKGKTLLYHRVPCAKFALRKKCQLTTQVSRNES